MNADGSRTPHPLLWHAVRRGSNEASATLIQVSNSSKDAYWLGLLAAKGNADAAWALYQIEDGSEQADKLMRMAARGNVPEAQYQYAMATEDVTKRLFWLTKASEQQYLPAQITLADWHMLNQDWTAAKPLLLAAAEHDTHSAYELGRLFLFQSDISSARTWLQRAANAGNETATALFLAVQASEPRRPESVRSMKWSQSGTCVQRIAMVGTSFFAWQHARKLHQYFHEDERLASLPLCVAEPVWITSEPLACVTEPRIKCQLAAFRSAVNERVFDNLIIVTDRGKANVDNGVMYLDIADDYDVFVHELAHFAGFVDEYPMPAEQANLVCRSATAPNLVLAGELTYQPLSRIQEWQTLDHTLSLSVSRTCEKVGVAAYKPSTSMTFLEYHDSGHIPSIYLALWRSQIETNAFPTLRDHFTHH